MCTDISLIAKQLNDKDKTIQFLKERINQIEETQCNCKLCEQLSK